jgi:hypothetical protein
MRGPTPDPESKESDSNNFDDELHVASTIGLCYAIASSTRFFFAFNFLRA